MIIINNTARIVEAVIFPAGEGESQAKVVADMDDGRKNVLVLSYFDDELTFIPSEFVGLTEDGVSELFRKKDVAYLQS